MGASSPPSWPRARMPSSNSDCEGAGVEVVEFCTCIVRLVLHTSSDDKRLSYVFVGRDALLGRLPIHGIVQLLNRSTLFCLCSRPDTFRQLARSSLLPIAPFHER